MKRTNITFILVAIVAIMISSCANEDMMSSTYASVDTYTIFNISIDGNTKSVTDYIYDSQNTNDHFDSKTAMSLIGSDVENGKVLINNLPVYEQNGVRTANISTSSLSSGSMKVNAFYPYASSVNYREDGSYAISFAPNDIQKGPMVSNAVVMRNDSESEMVNLKFHHITNSVGFKICDNTSNEALRGLIHIRKVTLNGVATDGLFVCNGEDWQWIPNAKRQKAVIFEGDEMLSYGAENADYLGTSTLTENNSECSRVYMIPETLVEGKQFVEVEFDIDPFTYEGSHYNGRTGQKQIISLSDVIPGNMFELGLQYTFVLGIDISSELQPIEFSASVDNWKSVYDSKVLNFDNE